MTGSSQFRYLTQTSPFGDFAIVWRGRARSPEIHEIFLPARGLTSRIRRRFPGARAARDRTVEELARDVGAFLRGGDVEFSLSRVFLERCGEFQRKVLRAEHAIPRGRVSTYGGIAVHIGAPRSARAVGRALATNPFPIVVPCHRAIRGDGGLGGFQGGVKMKRALLELEGVEISPQGRVLDVRSYYPRGG